MDQPQLQRHLAAVPVHRLQGQGLRDRSDAGRLQAGAAKLLRAGRAEKSTTSRPRAASGGSERVAEAWLTSWRAPARRLEHHLQALVAERISRACSFEVAGSLWLHPLPTWSDGPDSFQADRAAAQLKARSGGTSLRKAGSPPASGCPLLQTLRRLCSGSATSTEPLSRCSGSGDGAKVDLDEEQVRWLFWPDREGPAGRPGT